MAVDDRYKRASAIALLIPSMFTTHTDTTAGVDADERVAVAWMYSGISIVAIALRNRDRELLMMLDEDMYYGLNG